MPQRTNDFQEVAALIQESLVPHGAKVTVSAMVPGSTSDDLREIDVFIEAKIGAFVMKIAVETKDESRLMDATKMEAIIGKYRSHGCVPTNKVVVISRRGFSDLAAKRAKDSDIEIMSLDEARLANWKARIPGQFNLHLGPFPTAFIVEPALPIVIEPNRLYREAKISCAHGHNHG